MKKVFLVIAVLAAAGLAAPSATAEPVTAGQCGGASVLSSGDTGDTYKFTACTSLGVRAAIQRHTTPTNIYWKMSSPSGTVTCNWGATGDPVCSGPTSSGRWIPATAGQTVTITTSVSGCANCVVAIETPERPDV